MRSPSAQTESSAERNPCWQMIVTLAGFENRRTNSSAPTMNKTRANAANRKLRGTAMKRFFALRRLLAREKRDFSGWVEPAAVSALTLDFDVEVSAILPSFSAYSGAATSYRSHRSRA